MRNVIDVNDSVLLIYKQHYGYYYRKELFLDEVAALLEEGFIGDGLTYWTAY